ncbi:MAG TPA: hypothetical protein VK498_12485 [Ferruginibacter sp.]|nr:hypothetical protein [Ferruginibacter sp.]
MRTIIILVFIFTGLSSFAGNNDSLDIFKEFIRVCNAYKQLPLQLSLEYKTMSNISISGEDNKTTQAEFYIRKEGAYIRFGDAEQLITDSMVLVIMNNLKQMMISENNMDISVQMKIMMGPSVEDSAIQKMAGNYAVNKKLLDDGRAVIEIADRKNLLGTSVPVESTMLTYNILGNVPENILTTRRSLISTSRLPAISGKNEPGIQKITIPGKGDFYIKEDIISYDYKKIDHDANLRLPVLIKDRIIMDKDNNLMPVKAFETYTLIKN